MKYYIERNQYFTERGESLKPYYYIYYIKKFLGLIPYKKYSTERWCGVNGCVDSPLSFKTIEKAEEFIANVLCKGIKTEHIEKSTIKELTCKQ